GPLHVTVTLPAGAVLVAEMFVAANGAMRADEPHGPGPTSLIERTSYEHVTRLTGHVVAQLRVVPSDSTVAVFHAVAVSSQLPSQRRASYPVTGAPPEFAGRSHVTATVGTPEPRLRFETRALRFRTFDATP